MRGLLASCMPCMGTSSQQSKGGQRERDDKAGSTAVSNPTTTSAPQLSVVTKAGGDDGVRASDVSLDVSMCVSDEGGELNPEIVQTSSMTTLKTGSKGSASSMSEVSKISSTASYKSTTSNENESQPNTPKSPDGIVGSGSFHQQFLEGFRSQSGLNVSGREASIAESEDGIGRSQSGVVETKHLEIEHDDAGYKHVNQYIIIKTLGKGTFGKVKLCLNTEDGKLYAIKIVNKQYLANKIRFRSKKTRDTWDPMKMIAREVAIMKKLNHPNIVKLFEVIENESYDKLYLIIEFVAGGPVKDRRNKNPLPEQLCRLYIRDILLGLSYLHFNNIVHRDLKPDNLLKTDDGSIKIADFNVANFFIKGGEEKKSTAGTPAFLAPEVIKKVPHDPTSADIWSIGVCLFVFAFGHPPFKGTGHGDIFDKICRDDFTFPENHGLSKEIEEFITRLLEKDHTKRITLMECMNHPWVTLNGQVRMSMVQENESGAITVTEAEMLGAIRSDKLIGLFSVDMMKADFEPGEYLMRQGEVGTDMFFIEDGEVEIVLNDNAEDTRSMSFETDFDSNSFSGTSNSDGSEQNSNPGNDGDDGSSRENVIAVRKSGQFIGEIALFKGGSQTRTASVRAKTATKTLVVTKAHADEILKKRPVVKEQIQAEMLKRIMETTVFQTQRRLSSSLSDRTMKSTPPTIGGPAPLDEDEEPEAPDRKRSV